MQYLISRVPTNLKQDLQIWRIAAEEAAEEVRCSRLAGHVVDHLKQDIPSGDRNRDVINNEIRRFLLRALVGMKARSFGRVLNRVVTPQTGTSQTGGGADDGVHTLLQRKLSIRGDLSKVDPSEVEPLKVAARPQTWWNAPESAINDPCPDSHKRRVLIQLFSRLYCDYSTDRLASKSGTIPGTAPSHPSNPAPHLVKQVEQAIDQEFEADEQNANEKEDILLDQLTIFSRLVDIPYQSAYLRAFDYLDSLDHIDEPFNAGKPAYNRAGSGPPGHTHGGPSQSSRDGWQRLQTREDAHCPLSPLLREFAPGQESHMMALEFTVRKSHGVVDAFMTAARLVRELLRRILSHQRPNSSEAAVLKWNLRSWLNGEGPVLPCRGYNWRGQRRLVLTSMEDPKLENVCGILPELMKEIKNEIYARNKTDALPLRRDYAEKLMSQGETEEDHRQPIIGREVSGKIRDYLIECVDWTSRNQPGTAYREDLETLALLPVRLIALLNYKNFSTQDTTFLSRHARAAMETVMLIKLWRLLKMLPASVPTDLRLAEQNHGDVASMLISLRSWLQVALPQEDGNPSSAQNGWRGAPKRNSVAFPFDPLVVECINTWREARLAGPEEAVECADSWRIDEVSMTAITPTHRSGNLFQVLAYDIRPFFSRLPTRTESGVALLVLGRFEMLTIAEAGPLTRWRLPIFHHVYPDRDFDPHSPHRLDKEKLLTSVDEQTYDPCKMSSNLQLLRRAIDFSEKTIPVVELDDEEAFELLVDNRNPVAERFIPFFERRELGVRINLHAAKRRNNPWRGFRDDLARRIELIRLSGGGDPWHDELKKIFGPIAVRDLRDGDQTSSSRPRALWQTPRVHFADFALHPVLAAISIRFTPHEARLEFLSRLLRTLGDAQWLPRSQRPDCSKGGGWRSLELLGPWFADRDFGYLSDGFSDLVLFIRAAPMDTAAQKPLDVWQTFDRLGDVHDIVETVYDDFQVDRTEITLRPGILESLRINPDSFDMRQFVRTQVNDTLMPTVHPFGNRFQTFWRNKLQKLGVYDAAAFGDLCRSREPKVVVLPGREDYSIIYDGHWLKALWECRYPDPDEGAFSPFHVFVTEVTHEAIREAGAYDNGRSNIVSSISTTLGRNETTSKIIIR